MDRDPRKKASLGKSFAKSRAYNPIRGPQGSRIGLYTWLLARLSPRLFFLTEGDRDRYRDRGREREGEEEKERERDRKRGRAGERKIGREGQIE